MKSELAKLVAQDGIELTPRGGRLFGLCPFHSEKTPSFSVTDDNLYYCFGCGAGGGIKKWLMQKRGMNEKDARKEADRIQGKTPLKPAQKKVPRFFKDLPAGALATHYYRDENQNVLFAVCRFSGKPKIAQYTWDEKKGGWWNRSHRRRVLYRLPEVIAADKSKQVVIVEGEKCVDAMRRINWPGPVTTAPGGTAAVARAELSPLRGRRCLIIADRDKAGEVGARKLGALLAAINCRVRLVVPDWKGKGEKGQGDGWDVADAVADGWDSRRILRWCKGLVEDYKPPEGAAVQPGAHVSLGDNEYYQILGRGFRSIWFRRRKTQEIINVKKSEISIKFLQELAPLEWWLSLKQTKAQKITGDMFQQFYGELLNISDAKGRINIMSMRGRGATRDNRHYVYHLGDRLLVDNEPASLDDPRLSYMYSEDNPLLVGREAAPDTLRGFASAVMGYKWADSMSGRFFCGWLIASLVGGMLEWRPYVWLVAPAKAGKSWLADHIVKPLIGDFGVLLSKATTASVSRLMGSNSLPIVVDEAEPEKGGVILETLSAVRSGSSGTGMHTKASREGEEVIAIEPRSSMMFSSTKLPAMNTATKSRFLVLRLDHPTLSEAEWLEVSDPIKAAITEENCIEIRTWAVRNMPAICERIKAFSSAVAELGHDNRASKNIGAVLGAFSSLEGKSPEQCGWLDELRVDRKAGSLTEAERVLEQILGVRVQTDDRERRDITLATALWSCPSVAASYGLIEERENIYIAADNAGLLARLRLTDMAGVDLREMLLQLPFAERMAKQRRFGGIRKYPIRIPMSEISHIYDGQPVESAVGVPVPENDEVPF